MDRCSRGFQGGRGFVVAVLCLVPNGSALAVELELEQPVLHVARTAPDRFDIELDIHRVVVRSNSRPGVHPLRITGGELRFEDSETALSPERFRAQDLEVRAVLEEGALALESTAVRAFEGRWQVQGRVAFRDSRFDLTLRVERAALGELVDAIAGRSVDASFGILRGKARLAGGWASGPEWWKQATGSGEVALEGGTLGSLALFREIWNALIRKFPLLRLEKLKRGDPAPTQLISFTETFSVASGRAHSENAHLETDDYLLRGRGSLGLDGSLDYDTRFRLTTQGLKKVISLAKLPLPLGTLPERVEIPLEIRGALGNPVFRPDVTPIPFGVVKGLVAGSTGSLANSAKRAIGGTVGVVRGGVEKVLGGSKEESKEPQGAR